MRPSISFISLSHRAAMLMLLFVATGIYAQITPSADSYTNTAAPTTNYGTKTLLDVQSASQTTYIQFDLSAIPAGYTSSNIAKASLKLYVNAVTTAGSFNVDYVNGTWAESTITASNAPALGTTIVASVPLVKANVHDYILIDITPALGEWLSGTPNDGIALVGNSPLNASFDSKESTTQSHPPELDIVFTGGGSGGGTITGVLTGAGSGLTGGGTSGTLNLSLTNACAANQILQWNGTAWVCANMGGGGGGTVTAVGLTAPSTDFLVTGSPVTTSGTLGLGWLVAPDFNNTPNAIVKRDGSGNFSAGAINAASSFNLAGNVFDSGSFTNYNAFLGFAGNANIPPTGIANTAGGYQSLFSDTAGQGNTAYGTQALYSNTTGSGNIALGGHTLFMNTIGASNTAVGGYALKLATNASQNTATGNSALYSTTTGNDNTANGFQALYANTTGTNNTASGFNSLYLNTMGMGNTAIGYGALNFNTTGNNNTALGNNAGPDNNSPNLTNATAIGYNAVVSQSNALVLGGTGGNAVSVGIGTATPAYTLDVQGTGNFTGLVKFASGQTFPGAGTITGVTTAAGSGLTGGGTSGTLNLSIPAGGVSDAMLANPGLTVLPGTDLTGGGSVLLGGSVALNLDTTKVPQLATANTFTADQTVNGTVTATSFSGNGAGLTNITAPTPGAMNAALLRWYNQSYSAGNSPRGVAFDGSNIWVTNGLNAGTVTKLLASSGAVVSTYSVGINPQGVAFDGSNIWVANSGSNNVTKLLASSGAVVGSYPVGTNPQSVAFDGSNIWVTDGLNAGTVTKLLASSGAVVSTYSVGINPQGVAFDGSNIWVANSGSNNVTKLLASSGAVVGSYPVGNSPWGVAFDGSNIWVANAGSNNVTKLLASSGALVGTYAVGTAPTGVAFDGSNIWVANNGYGSTTVTKLLASSGALVGTYAVGNFPIGVAFDGSNIWAANWGSSNVTRIPVY